MRSIDDILSHLRRENIILWLDGGRLRYRAPKGSIASDLRDELHARKTELISFLATEESLPALSEDLDNRHEPFPLTDIQQAYWVGRSQGMAMGGVAVHGYLEIENAFDVERLEWAWNKVVQRHEMLRAIVLPTGQQRILEAVPHYVIPVTDLRGQPDVAVVEHLDAVSGEMSHQVLPSDEWPLFELRATRLADDRVRLHVSIDLLMCDLWSMYMLFHEWAEFLHDDKHSLPPVDVSFRDYVLAEQAYRTTPAYRRSEKYWFDRLDTLPLGPDLPMARAPETLRRPTFNRHSSRLSAQAWGKLKERAKLSGVTPSGFMLTAFGEVLGRWSKNPCFNINLTLFNRQPVHPQINNVVGDFTTTVLLAFDHSRRERFIDRALNLQEQMWHDLDHRAVTAVHVLREMARQRGGLQSAAMPVVFSSALGADYVDEGSPRMGQFGSRLGEVICTISQTPQVWLDHQAVEHAGELLFNWDAVDELFPAGMVSDMFAAYCDLLMRLSESDAVWEEPLRDLLPEAQARQRAEVNATDAPLSSSLLHELFAAQLATRGNEPAVISARRTLSYLDVAALANRIGRRLRALGALPNTLVAIVMEKGWEQVAGVLGVLNSGAAYVPIDPDLPVERLHQLLEDGSVGLVLTQSWIEQRLSWPNGLTRLCVDDAQAWASDSPDPLPRVQEPEDLAYVIYTSGSTGRPKGVMIDHRGAVNTVLDINRRYGVGPHDRVLALSALNFDLSVYDIFGLLAAGGAIVMPHAGSGKDATHWSEMLMLHQVTVWNTVPALLQMLVEYSEGRAELAHTPVRLAMLSGDWIPVDLHRRVARLWHDTKVFSLGGATEASIWSIDYPIEAVDPEWTSIPYGKPLSNQTYHVLNETLEPCPVWVPGQLYIGGIGLAKGYWRDSVKTDASFIVHPDSGERIYKTGDLGRYLPDGNIEFLGREDFQVKVNGYRIELGEVEAAMLQHPAVREVVVVAPGKTKETRQLVAYFVARQLESTDAESLKAPVTGLDSLDKVEFKLRQVGVRMIESEQQCVQLKKPVFDAELSKDYLRLRAYREFLRQPIGFDQFSAFMSHLLQMKLEQSPLPKYRYPSAGSLYPVQTYIYVKPKGIDGVAAGIYYYHPGEHRLILLAHGEAVDKAVRQAHSGYNGTIFEQGAFAIFSLGELQAIEPLYGEWSRDFCLLEAGYIGQLLMEKAPDHELGLCPIGKLDMVMMKTAFGWGDSQLFLQGFVGGRIDPEQIGPLNFVTQKKPATLEDQLRVFLRQKLPEYMIPGRFVRLDALPLTPNGKLDRKGLPSFDLPPSQKAIDVLPVTDTEKAIAEIVAEVLGLDVSQTGMYSNFFDLGADSVGIVRMNNRLSEEFGREIPIVEMFRYPTIGFLASFLSANGVRDNTVSLAHQRANRIRSMRQRRGSSEASSGPIQ